MIKNELYRVMIKNHFLVYLMLFVLLKIVFLCSNQVIINSDIEAVSGEYKAYISQFEGRYSPKSEKISADYNAMIKASEEYTALKSKYEKGEISPDVYREKAEPLTEKISNAEVLSLAYDELNYVKESPDRRSMMYINGWEALIGNERLDYILIAAVILLSLLIFAVDHETGAAQLMLVTVNGRSKAFYFKQLILIVSIVIIDLLFFAEEILVFHFRFGISDFNAPVQSLISFRECQFNISIIQALCIILIFRIIGSILTAEIVVFIEQNVKKFWTSALCPALVILIPYALFNNKPQLYYFQPVGMMLSSGYLKGKADFVMRGSILLSEPSYGVPQDWIYILTAIVVVASLMLFVASFMKFSLDHMDKKTKLILLFTISFTITFCISLSAASIPAAPQFSASYSKGMGFSDKNYCYVSNSEFKAVDPLHDESSNVIRDVIKSKKADKYYISDNYIYYCQHDINTGELCYYQMDKDDYDERLIYKEIKGVRKYHTDQKYLGLINTKNIENVSSDNYENEEITDMWADNDFIFTVDLNGVNMIDVRKQCSERIVDCQISPECIACIDGVIFYADMMNDVYSFDICTRRTERLNIFRCKKLFAAQDKLISVDFDYNIGIYNGTELTYINELRIAPTSNISYDGSSIYFADSNNTVAKVDLRDMTYTKMLPGISAYNVMAFPEHNYIHVYENTDEGIVWKFEIG